MAIERRKIKSGYIILEIPAGVRGFNIRNVKVFGIDTELSSAKKTMLAARKKNEKADYAVYGLTGYLWMCFK